MPIGGGGFGLPPVVPILLSPGNNSTGVSVTPTFEWDERTSGCTYSLIIYDANDTIIQQFDNLSTQTYTLTNALGYNTQYKWKIVATNSDGSTSSSIITFTTEQIPVPAQVSYIEITYENNNNAIPTFSWGSVEYADHYHIKITKP